MMNLLILVLLSNIRVLLGQLRKDLSEYTPYQTRFITKFNCSDRANPLLCVRFEGPAENCVDFELFEMHTDLKRRILAAHNGLRNLAAKRVGHEVANMNLLHWDDILSEMAKQRVLRCGNIDERDQTAIKGQNEIIKISNNSIFLDSFPGYKKWLSVAIHSWLENSNTYWKSANVTPYVQLIYPESQFVGCAGARVAGGTHFLCYYGPNSEMDFIKKFKTGKWCSRCPPQRSTCSLVFEGLCGLDIFADSNRPQSNSRLLFFIVLIALIGFDY